MSAKVCIEFALRVRIVRAANILLQGSTGGVADLEGSEQRMNRKRRIIVSSIVEKEKVVKRGKVERVILSRIPVDHIRRAARACYVSIIAVPAPWYVSYCTCTSDLSDDEI